MKIRAAILTVAALALPGAAPAGEPALGPIPAWVLRVIDGDTLEVAARVWIGQTVVTRVRLKDIDAPELSAPCQAAKAKAREAKAFLQRIVGRGPVTLTAVKPGKYWGRVVAEVTTAAGINLGRALVEAGVARRYDGGKREGWC